MVWHGGKGPNWQKGAGGRANLDVSHGSRRQQWRWDCVSQPAFVMQPHWVSFLLLLQIHLQIADNDYITFTCVFRGFKTSWLHFGTTLLNILCRVLGVEAHVTLTV